MKRRFIHQSARRRAGYTMLELVVNLASATLLLAGLASTVYISTFAFSNVDDSRTRARVAEVQADMMADLQCATSFSTATANTVTFTVPDRNGDGREETISYFLTAAPNRQLMYSFNGGAASLLLDNVTAGSFTYLTRVISAPDYAPPPLNPFDWGDRWN